MLETIVSGGHSGAGLGALRAAEAVGLRSAGGTTEAIPAGSSQPDRIERNVREADATLWFGETSTIQARWTVDACRRLGKPCLPIDPCAAFEPSHVALWIAEQGAETLHVTGSLEEEEPGIGDRVERFLREVFEQLRLPGV
jgi:hypothetical protein